MPRNYPPPAAVPGRRRFGAWRGRPAGLAAAIALASAAPLVGQSARSVDLFSAQPVNPSRFAVLARPVGDQDWNLLVLEQLGGARRCWTNRPDGLVEPSLNRFNFAGICSRYIDSNGYSLRVGEQDLAGSYRLRLTQVGDELLLQASTLSDSTDLVVGRGRVPLRDRDGFVQLSLDPGWSLQRRAYRGRGLSHLYFANGESLPVLLARMQPTAPAPTGRGTVLSRLGRTGGGTSPLAALPDRELIPGRPVPLQVIPFRE